MSFEELNDFSVLKKALPNDPKPTGETTSLKDDFDLFQDETVPPADPPAVDGNDEPPSPDQPAGDGQDAGGDPAEEEKFYDAKRDFPDEEVTPTSYADRVAASQGIVHKFNYLEKLGKDLESLGSGFGAIDLPSIIGDDLSKIEELQDLAKVAELSDEDAKKAIVELDKTINVVKSKYERISQQHKQQQEAQQMDEKLLESQKVATESVDILGLKLTEDMSNEELIQSASQALDKFIDKADDYVDEHGAREYTKALREREKAVASIKSYVDLFESKTTKQPEQNARPTAEQIESWYEEFRSDNPSLAIFKAPTEEAETAFLQYVKRQGFDLNGPRSFKTAYTKYNDFLEQMRSKKKVQDATNKNVAAQQQPKTIPVVNQRQPSGDKPLADQIDADMNNLLRSVFS